METSEIEELKQQVAALQATAHTNRKAIKDDRARLIVYFCLVLALILGLWGLEPDKRSARLDQIVGGLIPLLLGGTAGVVAAKSASQRED